MLNLNIGRVSGRSLVDKVGMAGFWGDLMVA